MIPSFLLKIIRKFEIDLRPHNMVLSNYEGKIRIDLGVIQVDIIVDIIIRLTLLVVIPNKAN